MSEKRTKQPASVKAKPKATIITGVRLPVEMRADLDNAASEDGRSTSSLIQKILSDWLRKQKTKDPKDN